MVLLEIKAPLSVYSFTKFLYHVIFIILIIFIDSRKCFVRVLDKNYGGVGRRSPRIISEINENNLILNERSSFLKNLRVDENVLKTKDDDIEKENDHQHLKLNFLKNQHLHSEHGKQLFKDTSGSIHRQLNHTENDNNEEFVAKPHNYNRLHHNLQEDDERHYLKLRADDKPTDRISPNDHNNQKIMDYFFSNDAMNPEARQKHRSQGIIINLKGLIPHDALVPEKGLSSTTFREVKNNNGDELLAFKAFEIDASPQPDSVSTSFTDEEEENINSIIDISKMTSRVEFIEESGSPTRNLSRKRRHWSSPNAEDEEDDEHSRRRFFRRRRRKRKRRHRHSKIVDDLAEDADVMRLPLKSHGPAYVITSAKELKKDWCRTVPLKQRIEEKNCKPKIISNNFCYGQCNSFFIPHQGRTGNSEAAFQSCAFCKPNKQRWITVTLQCPGQVQSKIEKHILYVESCRCMNELLQ